MKPTIVLLFHVGDILFSLGIVILLCLAVVVVFSTLASGLVKRRKSDEGQLTGNPAGASLGDNTLRVMKLDLD